MEQEMAEYLPLDRGSKMEDSEKQTSSRSSPIPIKSRKKGGFITMPFIIANEALENVASYGLLPNMTNYLMREYRMGFTTTQNLLFFWSATTNFLPIVGAIVADSYLGRFLTIGLGSIFSFLEIHKICTLPLLKFPNTQKEQIQFRPNSPMNSGRGNWKRTYLQVLKLVVELDA